MINQEVFDKLLEIGGPNLARRVIELFFEHTPGKVQSLEQSLAQQDLKTLERTAHSIKSSAANLGLEELRQVAAELERIANRGELEPCTALVTELLTRCAEAENSLRNKQKELESA